MKQLFFIAFLSIFFASKAQNISNQNYNFTLDQAISHALKNNSKAVNANRDIEISKQKKWETTTIGLPRITGGLDYLINIDFTLQGVSGNAFNPMGDPNAVSTIAFGTKHTMIAKATLSQLIFDGSYIVALQASKAYLQFFENAKKKTDADIKEQIINNYGTVLLTDESIKILEKNKSILEKNYNEVNQIFKNGLTEEESVEQIAITLATVKSSLENVKRLKDISFKMLKINLGLDIDSVLNLTDNLENLTIKNIAETNAKNNFNVKNNIDYQIVSDIANQKRLLLKLEKSKALPSLGAALNFGYNTFGNQFTMFDGAQKWNKYSNLGVGLSVPIFSSFAYGAKVKQAKIAYDQAQTQQKEAEQLLKLQFEKTKSDFDYSIEQYNTTKNNLALAERIEKKQQIKFKEGLSTSFDLAEAQRQLYASQQNYLQSMVDIINKKAALERVSN
jgi:outer membrane protein